jgi:beta-glucosidase
MSLNKDEFGKHFQWGVATSAYQIEGASHAYGKGLSIWDEFTSKKGRIINNHHGRVTTDFYHRFKQDIILMNILEIPNFRFSISWSRIFPFGTGYVNKTGVNFYNRVIDFCLESGIEPWITLYHWDLPLELEKKGGWKNREIVNWFSAYVEFCIKNFGDRVKHWIVLNEPMAFTGAGYFLGIHAPGRKGLLNFLPAVHHAALCQAEGARVAKSIRSDLKIGTTFSCTLIEPAKNCTADHYAAKNIDALLNRLFVEPLLGMGYPVKDLKVLNRLDAFIENGDEARLKFDMDFIGIQNYTREIVCHSWMVPFLQGRIIKASARGVKRTTMDWEIYPESVYEMLRQFSLYPDIPELIISENGAAFHDQVEDGKVYDPDRKEYLEAYLQQVLRARQEGINVNGYFVWSFTDNFEWAEGYQARFGLVHVNFANQRRIVKYSGRWYSNFLAGTAQLSETSFTDTLSRQ